MRSFIGIIAALLLLGSAARAQQVTVHLSIEDINTIVGHLDGKWSELNPVVQSLLTQAQTDLARQKAEAMAKATKPADKKP